MASGTYVVKRQEREDVLVFGLRCTAGLFSVTSILLLTWWLLGTHMDGGRCCTKNRLEAAFAVARVLFTGALGVWLSCVAKSALLRLTTIFIFSVWAQALLSLAFVVAKCGLPPYYVPAVAVAKPDGDLLLMEYLVLIFTVANLVLTNGLNVHLLHVRLLAAERTALLPPQQGISAGYLAASLAVLVHTAAGLVFVATRPEGSLEPIYGGKSVRARVLSCVMLAMVGLFGMLWLWALGHLYQRLFRVLVLAKRAAEAKSSAKNAHVQLLREVLLFSASLLSSLLQAVVQQALWQSAWLLRAVIVGVEALLNMVLAIYLSGTFSGAVQGTGRRASLARQRLQRRQRALLLWRRRQGRQEEEQCGWLAAVRDLAMRGVSLRTLLHFYKTLLPQWMAYEPQRHCTADVVFQCLIPMTARQGCAAAELLMGGRSRPDKMVTHEWANSFQDLLAAICADAFGECEYWLFSRLLNEDVETLEKWVEIKGLGDRSYWICAFSVNQHKGICQQRYMDPGIWKAMPPCACGVEKAYNTTKPCLPNGLSVQCEMNKFADMMQYLAHEDCSFSQVLAVDVQFRIFTRAWCVAELATAKELGMVQDVKIRSTRCLEDQKHKLEGLRIEDMEATREEDKRQILSSIEDHDEFNRALWSLIFNDLLPRWSSLDAEERMAFVGNILRWQGTKFWSEEDAPRFNPYRVSV